MTKPHHVLFILCRKMRRCCLPSRAIVRNSFQNLSAMLLSLAEGCPYSTVYNKSLVIFFKLSSHLEQFDFLKIFPWVTIQCFLGFEGGGMHPISLTYLRCHNYRYIKKWITCPIMIWISICSWIFWSWTFGAFCSTVKW